MKKLILPLAFLLMTAAPAWAADTNVSISVKAKDALFVGEAAGNAYVVVRDKRNGDVLAEGRTIGGSGDKSKIMGSDGYKRDTVLTDDKTAHFAFSLDLFEPTPVSIEASGPYGQMQSLVKSSTDYLLLPGKDYASGNGIVVELSGFIVDIMTPAINHTTKFKTDLTLPLQAQIAKLCGCHVDKSSPWPPERYDVEANVYRGDVFLASVKMDKLDQAGLYGANLKFQEPGTYRVMVTSFDAKTKESGVDSTTITLEP